MTIPGLSPVIASELVCIDCSRVLRREIRAGKKDKLLRVEYFCDTCKYGVAVTMQHANTQSIPFVEKTVAYTTPAHMRSTVAPTGQDKPPNQQNQTQQNKGPDTPTT